jgi:hypothetical protein
MTPLRRTPARLNAANKRGVIMTTTATTTETEDDFNPTLWDNFVWDVGYRTNHLGEYLLKMGDRIQGNKPMGLDEAAA